MRSDIPSQNSFDAFPQDRFQLLLERSSDAIAEFDQSLRYASLNIVWAAWFGLAPDDILASTNVHLATQWDPASLQHTFCIGMQQALQQVMLTGQTLRLTHYFRPHPIEMVYTPIQETHGSVSRIFAIGRSVSLGLPPSVKSIPRSRPSGLGGDPDIVSPAIVGATMPGLDDTQPLPLDDFSEAPADAALVAHRARDHAATENELQQAAQILQSAEFLQLVLDSIPQYIFWKDRNSVYLGCNRRWAEMAGIDDLEQAVGMTDDELPWTEEQRDWYLTCDRQVMETGIPMLRIKQSQRQADGTIAWRETSKIPIRDPQGQVIGLLGTIEDVTERKRAEDLLKQSETKYKKLAKREELLNRLSTQIRNSLELEQILQTVVREVRQLLDTDRVVIYQFDETWQGTVIVEDAIAPFRSILGKMEADNCFPEKLAELYELGRVRAIADIEREDMDDCHREFLKTIQVRANLCVPILIQQHLWGLLIAHSCRGPRDWAETEIELLQYLAGQVGVAIRQAQLYAQAMDNARQSRIHAQHLEEALKDLKQTQTQLIQTEKMSSLGQLVAGVAHEINNPVNFIYGNIAHIEEYANGLMELVQLYQKHYPTPEEEIQTTQEAMDIEFVLSDVSKILQSLRVGAERIRKIVLSLRNFSRLDEAEMKRVDIHEGIDSTLLILQHRFKASPLRGDIRLFKNYGQLPLVECYPSQLNQVFMNILSNAVDALENCRSVAEREAIAETGLQIVITTEAQVEDNQVSIRIYNNGPSIPEMVQQHLFDPFFTTKPIGQGTGLGLSISQQIVVQKHQGQLRCNSTPGQGVEFQIDIPILQRKRP